jgi:hypothetical protein
MHNQNNSNNGNLSGKVEEMEYKIKLLQNEYNNKLNAYQKFIQEREENKKVKY